MLTTNDMLSLQINFHVKKIVLSNLNTPFLFLKFITHFPKTSFAYTLQACRAAAAMTDHSPGTKIILIATFIS